MSIRMHRRLPLIGVGSAVLVAALATLLAAAPADTPKPSRLTVNAERVTGRSVEGNVKVTNFVNADIHQEDALFTCDTVVLRTQGDVSEFTCTGNPVYSDKDKQNVITGQTVVGQSAPRRAEFTGNVKIVSQPQKGDQFFTQVTTTKCQSLSYDYANKRGVARGTAGDPVEISQQSRKVWADEAVYDMSAGQESSGLITLQGNVRYQEFGDGEIREIKNIDKVTISRDNDWYDATAKPGTKISIDVLVKPEANKPAGTAN